MLETHDPIRFRHSVRLPCFFLTSLALLLSLIDAQAQNSSGASSADWPRYRGPNMDGISTETGWQASWPKSGPRQLWKISVGPGASTVVTSKGRLYTVGNVANQDIVYCLDPNTGKEVWRYSYVCPLDARQFEGGPAATPAVDEGRLYTVSHEGDLKCLDAQTGKVVWSKNLIRDFGGRRPRWGYAGSPLVEGKLLIIDVGGSGSSTVALDKSNGTLVWKSGNDGAGYACPIGYKTENGRGVVVFKALGPVGVSLADGKELWRHEWRTSYDVNAATPIIDGDKVFITSGYSTGCALLQLGNGKVTEVWRNRELSSQLNSPVLWQGHIYGIDGNAGNGTLKCLDEKTGKAKWSQGGVGAGTLIIADGKLIVLSERGELIIARAVPDGFEAISRAQVLGGRCWVAPVFSGGKIYCRNNDGTLVCLDVSGK